MEVRPGTYQHKKSGKFYTVLGVGYHSETKERLVVYQAQYDSDEFGNEAIWIRPLAMFTELVEIDGEMHPRFEDIGE